MDERVADAVQLLRSTLHEYRYTFESYETLRAFMEAIRAALGYDVGRLRWRLAGEGTASVIAVFWLAPKRPIVAPEPPAPFA